MGDLEALDPLHVIEPFSEYVLPPIPVLAHLRAASWELPHLCIDT